jgi:hypothetical protein
MHFSARSTAEIAFQRGLVHPAQGKLCRVVKLTAPLDTRPERPLRFRFRAIFSSVSLRRRVASRRDRRIDSRGLLCVPGGGCPAINLAKPHSFPGIPDSQMRDLNQSKQALRADSEQPAKCIAILGRWYEAQGIRPVPLFSADVGASTPPVQLQAIFCGGPFPLGPVCNVDVGTDGVRPQRVCTTDQLKLHQASVPSRQRPQSAAKEPSLLDETFYLTKLPPEMTSRNSHFRPVVKGSSTHSPASVARISDDSHGHRHRNHPGHADRH